MPRLQYLYLAKLRLREGALIFENAQVLHEAGKSVASGKPGELNDTQETELIKQNLRQDRKRPGGYMEFTHIDENGHAAMVDVTAKEVTSRMAIAEGTITVSEECFRKISEGTAPKGDVLGCARIAGIMGAKRTSELIPLCHILNLTQVTVDFEMDPEKNRIRALCTVRCKGRTGVEMEALTGVSLALLTIYDMCKAIDKAMEIGQIRLLHKEGGKSGIYDRESTEGR